MRSTSRILPWLVSVEQGAPIQANDRTQAVADLRAAQLVDGSASDVQLTSLGRVTLGRWREIDILNTNEQDEVARASALLAAALSLSNSHYGGMFAFWCELTSLHPADYWLQDLAHMYFPSYLDCADSADFRPFRLLVSINQGRVGTIEQWKEWLADEAGYSPGLDLLIRRVEGQRPGGRRSFCRAMEAYRLARVKPSELPQALAGWGIR
jgi:hypothetical protein